MLVDVLSLTGRKWLGRGIARISAREWWRILGRMGIGVKMTKLGKIGHPRQHAVMGATFAQGWGCIALPQSWPEGFGSHRRLIALSRAGSEHQGAEEPLHLQEPGRVETQHSHGSERFFSFVSNPAFLWKVFVRALRARKGPFWP